MNRTDPYAVPTIAVAVVLPATFLVCFFTLGAAIDWPNSLNGDAASYLPLIAEHVDTVRFGYSFYFGACALHAVLAAFLALHIGITKRPWLAAASVIGVLAGLFKMLGIARWLAAMPAIATMLDGDPSAVAVAYEALNGYAGLTLGEGVGVGLFTGLWFGLVALSTGPVADEEAALPTWLRALFAVTALLSLTTFTELYGNDTGAVPMLTGYMQYFGYWFLAAALVLRLRAQT